MIIALAGPRGVGKTTVGKELAKKKNFDYLSFDEYTEKLFKKQGGIIGYATKHGWDKYYQVVFKELRKLLPKFENIVLDCGAGAFVSHLEVSKKNAALLRDKGKFLVLLPCEDIKEAVKLLFGRERKRDWWDDWDDKKLFDKVSGDYLERIDGYQEIANILVYVKDKSVREIVEEVSNQISS